MLDCCTVSEYSLSKSQSKRLKAALKSSKTEIEQSQSTILFVTFKKADSIP